MRTGAKPRGMARKLRFHPSLLPQRPSNLSRWSAASLLGVCCVLAMLRCAVTSEQAAAALAAVAAASDGSSAGGASEAPTPPVEKFSSKRFWCTLAVAACVIIMACVVPVPRQQRGRPAATQRAPPEPASRDLKPTARSDTEQMSRSSSKSTIGMGSISEAPPPSSKPRAIVAAEAMSVQLRGQLSSWLKGGGCDRELALAAEAAALFSVLLAREAVASESQRKVAFAICPFDTLSVVFATHRTATAQAARWQGKVSSVRKTAEWSRLKDWFDSGAGMGLLLKPSGDVYATFANAPEPRPPSRDPWSSLAPATTGVVVVVCERPLLADESGRISVYSASRQWSSPEILQQAMEPQAPEKELTVQKVALPSAFAKPALMAEPSDAATAPGASSAPTATAGSLSVPATLKLPGHSSQRLFRRQSFPLRFAAPPTTRRTSNDEADLEDGTGVQGRPTIRKEPPPTSIDSGPRGAVLRRPTPREQPAVEDGVNGVKSYNMSPQTTADSAAPALPCAQAGKAAEARPGGLIDRPERERLFKQYGPPRPTRSSPTAVGDDASSPPPPAA